METSISNDENKSLASSQVKRYMKVLAVLSPRLALLGIAITTLSLLGLLPISGA